MGCNSVFRRGDVRLHARRSFVRASLSGREHANPTVLGTAAAQSTTRSASKPPATNPQYHAWHPPSATRQSNGLLTLRTRAVRGVH